MPNTMLLMYDITNAKDKGQLLVDFFNWLTDENIKFQVNTIADGSKILSIHASEEEIVNFAIINTTTYELCGNVIHGGGYPS